MGTKKQVTIPKNTILECPKCKRTYVTPIGIFSAECSGRGDLRSHKHTHTVMKPIGVQK